MQLTPDQFNLLFGAVILLMGAIAAYLRSQAAAHSAALANITTSMAVLHEKMDNVASVQSTPPTPTVIFAPPPTTPAPPWSAPAVTVGNPSNVVQPLTGTTDGHAVPSIPDSGGGRMAAIRPGDPAP